MYDESNYNLIPFNLNMPYDSNSSIIDNDFLIESYNENIKKVLEDIFVKPSIKIL
jgi:hypothetical protein